MYRTLPLCSPILAQGRRRTARHLACGAGKTTTRPTIPFAGAIRWTLDRRLNGGFAGRDHISPRDLPSLDGQTCNGAAGAATLPATYLVQHCPLTASPATARTFYHAYLCISRFHRYLLYPCCAPNNFNPHHTTTYLLCSRMTSRHCLPLRAAAALRTHTRHTLPRALPALACRLALSKHARYRTQHTRTARASNMATLPLPHSVT